MEQSIDELIASLRICPYTKERLHEMVVEEYNKGYEEGYREGTKDNTPFNARKFYNCGDLGEY